jgi:hypothetical protein
MTQKSIGLSSLEFWVILCQVLSFGGKRSLQSPNSEYLTKDDRGKPFDFHSIPSGWPKMNGQFHRSPVATIWQIREAMAERVNSGMAQPRSSQSNCQILPSPSLVLSQRWPGLASQTQFSFDVFVLSAEGS